MSVAKLARQCSARRQFALVLFLFRLIIRKRRFFFLVLRIWVCNLLPGAPERRLAFKWLYECSAAFVKSEKCQSSAQIKEQPSGDSVSGVRFIYSSLAEGATRCLVCRMSKIKSLQRPGLAL